ncbi:MAG: RagB/SusD family nutrient uptake outer membrane protein [Bacteroidales bacterium]
MKKFIYILLFGFFASSCSSFLDVKPDKTGNSDIYHIDQLVDLMGNPYMYITIGGTAYVWTELVFASDDCEISPYYYLKGGIGDVSYGVSIWNKPTFDTENVEGCTWQSAYKNMFTFNVVLENVDKVLQTTLQKKEMVRGEALFARAYFHFCALVAFAKYDENAPGIGYRDNTSPNSTPTRETVKYTLNRIAKDIDDAEKALTLAGKTQFEQKRNFRITLPTLYAFKARFELYRGNYSDALDASQKALNGHSKLVDFKNDPLYKIYNPLDINILDKTGAPTGKKLHYYEMTDLLSEGSKAVSEYEELYLPHVTDMYFSDRVVPISKDLYDIFNKKDDERWKRFYNNNYNIAKVGSLSKDGFKYEDQINLNPWEYHSYHRFIIKNSYSGKLYIVGPTTAEMMLIKAECLAREGKTLQAQATLRELRQTRFTTIESANDIGGSVQDVLDERRRELTAIFRWYDIKRLNGRENANITITKKRLTNISDKSSPIIITELKPNDPFYALPITTPQLTLMGWENN